MALNHHKYAFEDYVVIVSGFAHALGHFAMCDRLHAYLENQGFHGT